MPDNDEAPQPGAVERLLVVEPFDDHAFGDRIESEAGMKRALKTHPHHVRREVVGPEAVAAEPATREQTPAEGRGKHHGQRG
jgi:hypothetical protein